MNILVVDDELPICELLKEFLSIMGHTVTIASSGEEAVALLNRQEDHVILLDIKMPGIDGIEVLQQIKKSNPMIKVIMLSAFGDSHTIERAIDKGADYYMEKPIELKELLKVLEDLHE